MKTLLPGEKTLVVCFTDMDYACFYTNLPFQWMSLLRNLFSLSPCVAGPLCLTPELILQVNCLAFSLLSLSESLGPTWTHSIHTLTPLALARTLDLRP